MQQRSLNSSLEATVGSPLVHLGGMLLNGSMCSLPNSPLQPSVTSITYGPWYTTFAKSLILDGPILPCTTATAGSDVVQSGRPIFDDFFQHLWPSIGNNTANVVFQTVKRLWLIRIDP
ncbi:hypothetical protein TNCV_2865571 [Trichonephila clavipes]|nr:hypothetical protein TNCV_2865571 [Trichonephila clavipes]